MTRSGNDAAPAAVLATRNHGKLVELRPMFDAAGLRVIDLDEAGVPETAEEDALECFATYAENAMAKARYFRDRTGRPAYADDSGLSVEALGGAPGVHSKRWSAASGLSGTALESANKAKLLDALRGETDRRAAFVCAAAFAGDGVELVRLGRVEGEVLEAPRGTGGFGYDPLVYLPELGATFAEAAVAEKERVSHRGRAFRALLSELAGRAVG